MSISLYDAVPILERAKKALAVKSDADLSRELGVTTATMSGYKKRRSLPMEQCIKIAEQTGVSLDWLILGKGGVQPENTAGSSLHYDDGDAVWIPLYSVHLSAGNGLDVFGEEVEQLVPFSRAWLHSEGLYEKDLICAWTDGDSMRPTLQPSDIVVINRARTHGDGVFAVRIGNALRVKRLQWLVDGSLRIISDNPAYNAEQINPEEMEGQFAVIGECHTAIGRVL